MHPKIFPVLMIPTGLVHGGLCSLLASDSRYYVPFQCLVFQNNFRMTENSDESEEIEESPDNFFRNIIQIWINPIFVTILIAEVGETILGTGTAAFGIKSSKRYFGFLRLLPEFSQV